MLNPLVKYNAVIVHFLKSQIIVLFMVKSISMYSFKS